MSAFETVIYEKKGPVASVTLNRPKAHNSYNIQMRDDLSEVLSAARDDDEVRVVVFTGAGDKAFCAGADLHEFLTAPPPVRARQIRFARDIWGLFLRLQQPMIAALHGYVLGSGLEIALCCDIIIASADSTFGLPETGLGIIPAAGGTQTLPRLVGHGHALELLLAGQWIDAQKALEIGLVNQVVPRQELPAAADEMAVRIASLEPNVVQLTKQAVCRGLDMSLAEGLALEQRLSLRLDPKGCSREGTHPEKGKGDGA